MKRTFGQRINEWLAERPGEVFKTGKWRFWLPCLIGLTILNAIMTAVIFGADGMQRYVGSIVVLAGAVLCWLAIGLLHYSDSEDRLLAMGVAVLDSVTLLFVAAHFSFLLWTQGHLWILRAAEDQYRQDLATHNARWAPVKESNDRIAATVERIANVEKETERLRNDTAYWSRRNKVQTSRSGIKFEASLTPMEVPPAPVPPAESSAAFLAGWDSWIRIAGFGELALAVLTLIFVRTRTAMLNSRSPRVEEFPAEIYVENRLPAKREKFTKKKEPAKNHGSFNPEGLKRLREALKDISFRLHGFSFKSHVKDDCVWILMMRARHGTQETAHSAKAKLSILDDAMTMPRDQFRERLTNFLRQNDFEI